MNRCRIEAYLVAGLLCYASAQASQWSIDKPMDRIPDAPVTGQLFGKDFKLKSATLNDTLLRLASAGEPWPDCELLIFVKKGALEREIVVTPEADDKVPHVHMKFTRPGKKFPRTLMYTQEYSMRLEVVSRTESEIKFKIHLSLPDYQKSHVIGVFNAQVK